MRLNSPVAPAGRNEGGRFSGHGGAGQAGGNGSYSELRALVTVLSWFLDLLFYTLFFLYLQNKTPLINENLKKCLNTKDGELVFHVHLS